ncbi:hypothetical protein JCM9279_003444, partial [Rhodotorula babjevae]
TRACIRWRHQVGLLVFKVTNDRQCLTFKTRSTTYLNRFDALNRAMLRHYQDQRRPSSPAPAPAPATGDSVGRAGAATSAASAGHEPAARVSGGGEAGDEGSAKAKKRRSKKKAK